MTIPTYSIIDRKMLPPEYPPVAEHREATTEFQFSYEGTKDLEIRVRKSLSSYARSEFRFWRYTALIVAVGGVLAIALARVSPVGGPIFIAILAAIGGPIVPVMILRQIDAAAEVYAVEGQKYGATYDDASILWGIPGGEYYILFSNVRRVFTKEGVTVLGLRGSRAICVLPVEILPDSFRSRIRNVARRARIR